MSLIRTGSPSGSWQTYLTCQDQESLQLFKSSYASRLDYSTYVSLYHSLILLQSFYRFPFSMKVESASGEEFDQRLHVYDHSTRRAGRG
jgi:hypothetical protein